ncbi:lipopolysaccharide biosynthesis protein [Sphingopyxis sp. MWB1]|uniref:lipopolysaccharide biosynthesis protein n=1 Tax=Sphingopyxis sp. MWB1 TaxID=1537715 RepID=UPI00051A2E2C|nr:lipopolysaccharide biosynthesis protein [Sphingopyxis sp. MWB1]
MLDRIELFSLRDMGWQYAASFGVAIFGALYILTAGRVLGPQDFGVYALAAAVPTVVNALFDYRIQEVSIVVLSEKASAGGSAGNIRSLLLFDVAARVVAFGISVPAGILVLRALGIAVDPAVPLLAALGVFGAKVGIGPAIGLMRLSGNIQKYALLQSLDWALRLLGFGIAIFLGRASVEAAFLVQVPPAIVINLGILHLAHRIAQSTYGSIGGLAGALDQLRIFCRERSKLLFSSQTISAVDSVVKELDTLICGIFLSPHNVAVYKIAKSVAAISWKCVDPIFVVILPNIAAYAADGKLAELSAILKKTAIYLLGIALFIFLAGWALVFPFTQYVLGPGYDEVPSIFPLISLWIVVALPFIWTHSVAIASGNAPLQAMSGLLGAVIGVAALVIGAASWSLSGAALGLSVAYAATFVISWVLLVKKKIVIW